MYVEVFTMRMHKKSCLPMLVLLALSLAACKSTKVAEAPKQPFPDFSFPEFPELFITVHNEDLEEIQQSIVPDSWLSQISDFNNRYTSLQADYAAKKTADDRLPDVTFPQTPELLITVHKDELALLQQSVVSDDWLYKLADFCDQYRYLQNEYAKAKAQQ